MAYGPILGRVCWGWRHVILAWRRAGLAKNEGKPMDYVWAHGAISAAVQAILDGDLRMARFIAHDRRSVLVARSSSSPSRIPGTVSWAREKQRTNLAMMWIRCVLRAILIAPLSPEQTQEALAWVWPEDASVARDGWGHPLRDGHMASAILAANDMAFVWMHQRMVAIKRGSVRGASEQWLGTQFGIIFRKGMVQSARVIGYGPNVFGHCSTIQWMQRALLSGSPAILAYMGEQFERKRKEYCERRRRRRRRRRDLRMEHALDTTMEIVRRAGVAIFEARWDDAKVLVKGTGKIRQTLSWCYAPLLCRHRCQETGQWVEPQFDQAAQLQSLLGASMAEHVGSTLVRAGEKVALLWLSERGLLVGKMLVHTAMGCGEYELVEWLMETVGSGVSDTTTTRFLGRSDMSFTPAMVREWRIAGAEWRHPFDRSLAWERERVRGVKETEAWLCRLRGLNVDAADVGMNRRMVRHTPRGAMVMGARKTAFPVQSLGGVVLHGPRLPPMPLTDVGYVGGDDDGGVGFADDDDDVDIWENMLDWGEDDANAESYFDSRGDDRDL